MRPRQEMIEMFSTFLTFKADRLSGWVSDQRLHRSMQRCLEAAVRPASVLMHSYSSAEQFWVLYWHRCWQMQENPAAEGHLSAYLQECCYWTAQQVASKLTTAQFGVADYAQMAMAEVQIVLKRFKPDRGANLHAFASVTLARLVKDRLRHQQEANFCTNLGLLRRISKKRLLEVLKQIGLSAPTIAQYQLAWVCFNALYVPSPRRENQIPAADRALWVAIADLYNTEREHQLPLAVPAADSELIERWLNQCATWTRAYFYPTVESLNAPHVELNSTREIQDDLTNPWQESLLSDLISQEEYQEHQARLAQIHHTIVATIAALDPQSQELLRLYYQQGLTQQKLMQQLQISQATISRRLSKAREALLLALVRWSQKTLNNPPTSHLIKDMSAALEEWLGVHYGGLNSDSSGETASKETE